MLSGLPDNPLWASLEWDKILLHWLLTDNFREKNKVKLHSLLQFVLLSGYLRQAITLKRIISKVFNIAFHKTKNSWVANILWD